MKISLDNLKSEVTTRINAGGLSSLSACQLNAASNAINGNALIPRVATIADLPPVAQSEGYMIYVDDINEYRYSNGTEWTDDVTSTYELVESQILSWGTNATCVLGDGTNLSRCSPVREISSSINWSAVSTKGGHVAALKIDGTIWSWGGNSWGEIGDGTQANKSFPVREISSSTTWCAVAGGYFFTNAIKTDGTLWSWGINTGLGDGTCVNKCSPVRERSSSTNWCTVSAAVNHTSAIKTDGTLWGWGTNTAGFLGDGTLTNRCSPVQEFCSATNWCFVSSGRNHTAAIKTDGTLWGWGNNGNYSRTGDGTIIIRCSPVREFCSATNWCATSGGDSHSSALKTDGTLWIWGDNRSGQLGLNSSISTVTSPVQEVTSSTNWCLLNLGRERSAAIKTDGTLWSWGCAVCGALGDGSTSNRSSPVQEISSSTNWDSVSTSFCFNNSALKIIFEKGF